MNLDILIVNWNSGETLRACIDSIRAADVPAGSKIRTYIIDNASTDGSATIASLDGVTLLRNRVNSGFAAANNFAGRKGSGDWVLFLNPDTELRTGAIAELMRFIDTHPDVQAVAPKLLNPDGTFQNYYTRFPTLAAMAFRHTALEPLTRRSRTVRAYLMDEAAFHDAMPLDQPPAAALAVRRDALDRVGWMDERFPLFFNDVDLCFRLRRAGISILFCEGAEIVHHGKQSLMRADGRDIDTEYLISMQRYFRTHHGRTAAFILKCAFTVDAKVRGFVLILRLISGRISSTEFRARIRCFMDVIFERSRFVFTSPDVVDDSN